MLEVVRERLLMVYLTPLLNWQVVLMFLSQNDVTLFLVESNVLTGNCLLAARFWCRCFFLLIIVQLQLFCLFPHCSPLPCLSSTPSVNPPYHCLCWRVLYLCSVFLGLPLPLLSPFTLPSGHCQFVLYFLVSGSILLICLIRFHL